MDIDALREKALELPRKPGVYIMKDSSGDVIYVDDEGLSVENQRYFGWRGAIVGLCGMLTFPMLVVISLTLIYTQFAANPAVAGALRGMGAVAAGLVAGMGLK